MFDPKKIVLGIALLALIFFHIYPQALPITIGGRPYSFITGSGVVGLILFLFNRAYVPEMGKILTAYVPITIMCLATWFINGRYYDPFWIDSSKSLIAWFFSAYLIVYIFYKIHPEGSLQLLLLYVVAAIIIQGIISIAMYMNPAVDKFFTDIMMLDELAKLKRDETRGERLLGYGIAFFGVGILAGVGLILLIFILMTLRTSLFQRILLSVAYAFVFYVGLLSARTTLVGCAASIILLAILILNSKKRVISNGQLMSFFAIIIVLISIGQTMCYFFFPQFADWAFEAFTNYSESGTVSTKSSDGIYNMFIFPETVRVWIFGDGHMLFRGTDVGFSRLLLYIGLPGAITFFYFQYRVMKFSFTKYVALNYTLLVMFLFSFALNTKGLADVNSSSFIILFYIMYRKHYMPKINAPRRPIPNSPITQYRTPVQNQN